MIKIDMYTTIITLYKQGISQRQIAIATKINRKTVRKIINNYKIDKIEDPIPYKRTSKLENWHTKIVSLFETNLTALRIHQEIQLLGYDGSYSSLTRYLKKHKIKTNTCVRFHTPPGEEAQVDFGDIGMQRDSLGKIRKAYVFNMRLSYSRLDYYEVVFDQKIATWIQCHINAFNYFGGAAKFVKLDNLKSGVIDSNFYEPIFQKEYKRMAEHYGLLLSPCRVYQPQEKGKVESGIKYVKNNFFAGRKFDRFEQLTKGLERWLENANMRIHGTIKEKPREVFNSKESDHLLSIPLERFDLSSWHYRIVAKDCHITVDNNYYSVPAKYVSENVLVKLTPNLLQIYDNNKLITSHSRSKSKGVFSTITNHYAIKKRFCPGFEEYDNNLENKMENIGSNCAEILKCLKEENSRDWHKGARGIISLQTNYSNELIDKACMRALHYGISSYRNIKAILVNNATSLPMPKEGGEYAKFG